MKTLIEAAKNNPELAADLRETRAKYESMLQTIAARHGIEVQPPLLDDDDLDSVGGGLNGRVLPPSPPGS